MVFWTMCLCVHVISRPKIQTTPFLPHLCLLQQPDTLYLSVSTAFYLALNFIKRQILSMSFEHRTSQTVSLVVISLSYYPGCSDSHEQSHGTKPRRILLLRQTAAPVIKWVPLWFVNPSKGKKVPSVLYFWVAGERVGEHVSKGTSGVVRKQVMWKVQWKDHACLNMTNMKPTDRIFERNESHYWSQ